MKLLAMLLLTVLPIQWEPSFENAKKLAKERHELILLNFSGSDWCGPCIVLRKDYLENDVFTNMATDHLIVVNADFPRNKKKLTTEQIKRNELLAEQYNSKGIFPLTLLLNADGKVLKSWEGKPDVAVEKWVQEIERICAENK